MESMSGAPVPKDFNAEEAINMEEVRTELRRFSILR